MKVQAVAIDGDGADLRGIGPEGDDAQFEGAQVQLLGNARGQHALHGDADMGKLAAKGVDGRQQVHAGVLVGRQLQVAALQALQLVEGARGLAAQGQQAQRVLAQEPAGGGERAIARGAVEEGFAHRRLQLADDLADGRLGAVQAHRGAGETALLGHGEKGFELAEFHGIPSECSDQRSGIRAESPASCSIRADSALDLPRRISLMR